MELYLKVRQACLIEGRSQRSVARLYGLSRRTIVKMLEYSSPPGYRRKSSPLKPKLDPHQEFIDEILRLDQGIPLKQRHTARRIYNRLKEERGFDGGYTIVRVYVGKRREKQKEMFIPLYHSPGGAQADFGEAQAVIGGVHQKVHLFIMDIPHSDGCFVKAYFRENTESFCDGHVSAFEFFEGVPVFILYDNTKIAVTKILGDGRRLKTKSFTELQSHYLFTDRFARVGKGNDKGKVENLVGYARRNFLVPVPEFATIDELNAHLLECCLKRQKEILPRHTHSIGERLQKDKESFLRLPPVPYAACHITSAFVSSESLVSFKGNFYSVPVSYGYNQVSVKGYVDRVEIVHVDQLIATHKRLYGKREYGFNPLHYLPLLERKTGAFGQAAPLQGWNLPPVFEKLKTVLENRDGKSGLREYIRILRLLASHEMAHVTNGIEQGFQRGVLSYDGIKHLVLWYAEKRPAHLNLMSLPDIPCVRVHQTKAASYQHLIGGAV